MSSVPTPPEILVWNILRSAGGSFYMTDSGFSFIPKNLTNTNPSVAADFSVILINRHTKLNLISLAISIGFYPNDKILTFEALTAIVKKISEVAGINCRVVNIGDDQKMENWLIIEGEPSLKKLTEKEVSIHGLNAEHGIPKRH